MINKQAEARALWTAVIAWPVIAALTYFYVLQLGVRVSAVAVFLTCAIGSAIVIAACFAEYLATTKSQWMAVLGLVAVTGALVALGAGITRTIPVADSSDDLRHMVGRVSFALLGLFIGVGCLLVAEALRRNKTLFSVIGGVCFAIGGLAAIWMTFAAESIVGVLRFVAAATR